MNSFSLIINKMTLALSIYLEPFYKSLYLRIFSFIKIDVYAKIVFISLIISDNEVEFFNIIISFNLFLNSLTLS